MTTVQSFVFQPEKPFFEIAGRKNPYRVHQQSFLDFVDYKALSDQLIKNRSRNLRRETVNWLKIKVLRFEKDSHHIQYKYRYEDNLSTIKSTYADEGDPQSAVFRS